MLVADHSNKQAHPCPENGDRNSSCNSHARDLRGWGGDAEGLEQVAEGVEGGDGHKSGDGDSGGKLHCAGCLSGGYSTEWRSLFVENFGKLV